MGFIIHKLLNDAGILLTEFWDAVWHHSHSLAGDELPPTAVKPGSTGSVHPLT